jgi:hypothetical protein
MTKSNNPPPLPSKFKSLQTFGGGGAEFHHTFASSLLLLGAAVPSSYDDDVDIIHHADDLFVAVSVFFIISKSTKPDRCLCVLFCSTSYFPPYSLPIIISTSSCRHHEDEDE